MSLADLEGSAVWSSSNSEAESVASGSFFFGFLALDFFDFFDLPFVSSLTSSPLTSTSAKSASVASLSSSFGLIEGDSSSSCPSAYVSST